MGTHVGDKMARLVEWKSASQAKKILAMRLKAAKDYRRRLCEDQWRANERTAFGGYDDLDNLQTQIREMTQDTENFDFGELIEINYAFKNLRFLHAQMSSNPPVATPRPESTDLEDRRAAKAADQCMRYFLRQLKLQEVVDQTTLDTLVYGTGVTRTGFNPDAGDIVEFDEETGDLVLEGEVEATRISPWYIYIDPAAQTQAEIRYMFEEIHLTAEEAKSRFPTKQHLFKKFGSRPNNVEPINSAPERSLLHVDTPEDKSDEFKIYAYFEPGLPENGMLGRFCYCFEDGSLLTPPSINPNFFRQSLSLDERKEYRKMQTEPKKRPPTAYLPYHILTDIDVPGQVWGRSSLQYAGPAQNLMRSLDSATLEAVKAHGVARLVLPAGAKVSDDSISNSSVEVIQMETDGATGQIQFVSPPGMPPAMTELRNNMKMGVDDVMGVNESMFGQQSREQSGFAMQYAVNQGSMIRRRLFNKYVMYIESMYKGLLRLAIQHWDDEHTIKVLGDENAFDIVELKGIDLDGGYEIVTEYGTSLPLDPQARRDELLKLMPVFEKAGLDPKVLVENLKLAELESTQDILEMSRDRMKEMIDTMVASKSFIPPRKHQDHAGMLAYCKEYVMTAEYFALEEEYKALIEQHMDARAQMAATETPPAAPPGLGAPPAPAGAAPVVAPPPGAEGVPPATPAG
jgi:hypothetical protein